MKLILTTAAAVLLMTGGAFAQFNWTGVYVGGHAGYGWGQVAYGDVYLDGEEEPIFDSGEFDIEGWLAGAQAGANFQTGMFVLGAEGSLSWTNISGIGDEPFDPPAEEDSSYPYGEIHWIASLTGRVGIASDTILAYALGGIAFAEALATVTNMHGLGEDVSDTQIHTGAVVGLGVEAAIADNVTVRGEWRGYWFQDEGYNFGGISDGEGPDVLVDSGFGLHTFMVGVNFLMN